MDNLSVTAPYDVLIKFLAKLSESRPALHWRRLDLRPEPVRFNRNNSGNLLQNTPAAIRMRLNGAVRVIGYDGKQALQMEKQQKNKEKTIQNNPVKAEKSSAPSAGKQAGTPTPLDTKQAAGGAK